MPSTIAVAHSSFAHLGLVHMIVIPLVRTSHYHHNKIGSLIQAEIVYGRFEKVPVVFQPSEKVNGRCKRHVCSDLVVLGQSESKGGVLYLLLSQTVRVPSERERESKNNWTYT